MLRASWQLSAGVAVALFAGYLVCRALARPRLAVLQAFFLQFGVVVAVFAVYQHTAHYAYTHTYGAQDRALTLWHLERQLHLPSELTIERWVLQYPDLARMLNAYYAGLHLTSMTLFIIWMWWRHRAYYVLACITVAGTTLACVMLQRIPVAPPRLMPELGFADPGLLFGQSVYGPNGTGFADQLAAMPSIHVAWAAIIAGFAVTVSSSRWRWLLVVHFGLTCLVVVATANHWWLDGVVGVAIAGVVFLAARAVLAALAARSVLQPAPELALEVPAEVPGLPPGGRT